MTKQEKGGRVEDVTAKRSWRQGGVLVRPGVLHGTRNAHHTKRHGGTTDSWQVRLEFVEQVLSI